MDHLHQLLGEGEITVTQLMHAAARLFQPPPARWSRGPGAGQAPARRAGRDRGVGDLPMTLARCCAPLRPQPMTGYVTLGRGVTVHRSDCASLARMGALKPERVLKVEWDRHRAAWVQVEIVMSAYDRRGLLRDLTEVLAARAARRSMPSTPAPITRADGALRARGRGADLEQLARVLRRLAAVPNVLEARRLRRLAIN